MNLKKLNISELRNISDDDLFKKTLKKQLKESNPKDADLLLIKNEHNLFIPATDDDMKTAMSMPKVEYFRFTTDDARSLSRHRKYFKLLSKVIDHMPEELSNRFPTTESLHHEIKLQLRLFELHLTLGGKETYKVQSISFISMGEKRFKEYVNQSRDVILKYFLKDVSIEDFEENFIKLMFN